MALGYDAQGRMRCFTCGFPHQDFVAVDAGGNEPAGAGPAMFPTKVASGANLSILAAILAWPAIFLPFPFALLGFLGLSTLALVVGSLAIGKQRRDPRLGGRVAAWCGAILGGLELTFFATSLIAAILRARP